MQKLTIVAGVAVLVLAVGFAVASLVESAPVGFATQTDRIDDPTESLAGGAASAGAADPARPESTDRRELPPAERTIVVRIKSGEGGAPVARAQVHVLSMLELQEASWEKRADPAIPSPSGGLPSLGALWVMGELSPKWTSGLSLQKDSGAWALTACHGASRESDAHGVVALPYARPDVPLVVVAAKDGLWGVLEEIDPGGGPLDLILTCNRSLQVRVLSAGGQPCPGTLVYLGGETSWGRFQAFASGHADAEGKVTFDHLEQVVPVERRRALSLCAMIPSSPTVLRAVPYPVEVRACADLVLPPTTRVVIHLVDSHGQPYDPAARRPLSLHVDLADASAHVQLRSANRGVFANPLILPHAGVGEQITIRGASRPYGFLIEGVQFRTPSEPGKTIQVELKVDDDVPILTGRVLLPGGEPLRKTPAKCSVRYWGSMRHSAGPSAVVDTDAGGRFEFPLFAWSGRYLPVSMAWVSATVQGRIYSAELVLGEQAWRGRKEFGDIALKPYEPAQQPGQGEPGLDDPPDRDAAGHHVIATGRAVDINGKPVAGAIVVGRLSDQIVGARFRGVTGADGRFEIKSATPITNRIEIESVHTATMRSTGHTVIGGGLHDATFILYEQWRLLWNIELPPGIDGSLFTLVVSGKQMDAASKQLKEERQWVRVSPDGKVSTLLDCMAEADLRLSLNGHEGLLFERKNIVTRSSTANQVLTVRLPDLDLRELLRHVRFNFSDADGRPVHHVIAGMIDSKGACLDGRNWETRTGQLQFWTTRPTFGLVIQAPGHATTAFAGLRGGEQLRLRAAIPIVIEAIPRDYTIPGLYRLAARMVLKRAANPQVQPYYTREEERPLIRFDAKGRASWTVGAPGEYELKWYLTPHGPDGNPAEVYQDTTIRVTAQREPRQKIRSVPNTRLLKEAVERMPFYMAPK